MSGWLICLVILQTISGLIFFVLSFIELCARGFWHTGWRLWLQMPAVILVSSVWEITFLIIAIVVNCKPKTGGRI